MTKCRFHQTVFTIALAEYIHAGWSDDEILALCRETVGALRGLRGASRGAHLRTRRARKAAAS